MARFWRPAAAGVFAVAATFQTPPRDAVNPFGGPASVHGRVVLAETGTPARDITLSLTASQGRFAWVATTDVNGTFEFRDLPLSSLTLLLKKTGYVPVSTHVPGQVLKDRLSVDLGVIRLARAAVIAGRVVDMYGDPVMEMPIQAWHVSFPNPGERRLAPSLTVRTNDLGEYRLFGLMPGTYFVSAAGYGPAAASTFYGGTTVAADAHPVVVQPGDQVLGVDLPVRQVALAQLSGAVIDSSGQPGSDSFVVLSPVRLEGANVFTVRRVETDDEGRFRFPDLPPADYQLDVIALASMAAISTAGSASPAPGRLVPEFASVSVSLSEQPGEISIRTDRGSVLRGRVTVDGQRPSAAQLAGLKVTAVPSRLIGSKAEPDVMRDAGVSGDGTFMMAGVTGTRSIGIAGGKGLALLRVLLNGTM